MESLHWLCIICVNFDCSVINFAYGLNLHIISPNGAAFLLVDVGLETTLNKTFEVFSLFKDILHALDSDQAMLLLVAICLVSNCSKQAVSVGTYVVDLHAN